MVYTKTKGVPEKINYDPNKFYRTVGRDAVEDIEKEGKIMGKKRYIEAFDDKPAAGEGNGVQLLHKATTNKRIYHDPNSKPAGGGRLVEIAPQSENYVYFGRGEPLPGHGASFYNPKGKGPTNRTAPSEANSRLPRDHVIEVPAETPMVKAENLWGGLDDERIMDWSKISPDQHLSLKNG
jgi:hypothetical protein